MFNFFLSITTLILLALISKLSVKSNSFIIPSLLSFVLLIFFCGFVTYTPDWDGYVFWFENDAGRDYIFSNMTRLLKHYGIIDFRVLHIFYITFSAFFLTYFASKFKIDTLILVLTVIPIIYLAFTTQIRFFAGYFSMCLSIYYYFNKNITKTVLFFLIGIMSHLSLILFLPFILIIHLDIKKLYKITIYSSIIFLLFGFPILVYVQNMGIADNRFNSYTEEESMTSFLGASYKVFPLIINLIVIFLAKNKYFKLRPDLNQDRNLIFLYKLSIIFYVFLGLSFYIQIIGSRFVMPIILFQFLFLLVLNKRIKSKYITKLYIFLFLFNMLYVYIFPIYILNSSQVSEKVLMILESNYALKQLIL